MSEFELNLNVGDVYYNRSEPYKGYEVLFKKRGHWYLAYIKGDCSRITYIPNCREQEFHANWFQTSGEAELAKLDDLQKEAIRYADFIKKMDGKRKDNK